MPRRGQESASIVIPKGFAVGALFVFLGLLSAGSARAQAPRLESINDWLYVLQPETGATIVDIGASDFDFVVLDYSSDGSEGGEFTPAEIAALKATGKTVVAYFSIGEAESYRYYFDPAWIDEPFPAPDAPAWLGPTNPEWEGNYKVRYWQAGWHDVLLGVASGPGATYLDRIVNQGFDGIYLDIVDAYYYWSEVNVERTREEARQDMVVFIQALADYARTTRGVSNFLVVPQNAADIVWDDDEFLDALGQSYLATVDGIGIEDLFYDEVVAQPPAETQYRLDALAHYVNSGDTVLVVDYVWDALDPGGASNVGRYNDFQSQSLAGGFVPYAAVTDRALDSIVEVEATGGFVEPQPKPGGGPPIFTDGFESGDLGGWSAAVGD